MVLYSYEIKEKDYVAEMSKNDPNFKQFVDFVKQYNEQMIEMKKKKFTTESYITDLYTDYNQTL